MHHHTWPDEEVQALAVLLDMDVDEVNAVIDERWVKLTSNVELIRTAHQDANEAINTLLNFLQASNEEGLRVQMPRAGGILKEYKDWLDAIPR